MNILSAVALALSLPASAVELSLAPASALWLEGDSTLHPYASTSTALAVAFRL
jgi:hypothetical protein